MDAVLVIARVLFSIMMIVGGLNHFKQTDGMTGYAQHKKVPAARLSVQLSGLLLVLGGLSVVLGVWADLGALVLAVVLFAMAVKMHDFWTQSDPQMKQSETINFFKNISMTGGALFMFAAAANGTFGRELVPGLFS